MSLDDLKYDKLDRVTHEDPDKHLIGDSLTPPNSVTTVGITSDVGDSPLIAREDHKHSIDTTLMPAMTKGTTFPVTHLTGDIFYHTTKTRFYVSDGGSWWPYNAATFLGRMGFYLQRVAVQTITTATLTDISWDTEVTDMDGSITVPITNLPVPTDSLSGTSQRGDWGVSGWINWSAAPGAISFVRLINITTGQTYAFDGLNSVVAGSLPGFSVSPFRLDTGDTFKVSVYQNSGANRDLTAVIRAFRIGP